MDIHVRTPTITRPNRCVEPIARKSALMAVPQFLNPDLGLGQRVGPRPPVGIGEGMLGERVLAEAVVGGLA